MSCCPQTYAVGRDSVRMLHIGLDRKAACAKLNHQIRITRSAQWVRRGAEVRGRRHVFTDQTE